MSEDIIWVKLIVHTEDMEHSVVCHFLEDDLTRFNKEEAMDVLWSNYKMCSMRLAEKLSKTTK